MPLDEYASIGGGLKLKGAKVGKPKKKKRKDKSDLEKNLDDGSEGGALVKRRSDEDEVDEKRAKGKKRRSAEPEAQDEDDEEGRGVVHKTEAERRYEERKRKRVSSFSYSGRSTGRLLELAESSSARPELLKTHKERVEELNTYLSKLSEHHDMPKIGPG
ncbi:uncharacterized protein CTRU02_201601 [Colletotrichum truncatum]|uniref:Uncharacterized protein n=1 Tax=Colletotrichum truncatum TaxID=5467 RepID=A0ACC3ZHW9_COLTU